MIDPSTIFSIVTAPNRTSVHWKPGTVTWGEIIGWLDSPADQKEAGNYVFGSLRQTTVDHKKTKACTGIHRRKGAVLTRSILTLDVDDPYDSSFSDTVEMLLPYAAIVHTTYSSTPEQPRYRLLIPLDREVAPDEYHTAASAVMEKLGVAQFDPGSVQPERYMFLPAASRPDWFASWVLDGPPAPVDELLKDFDPDLSKLPPPKVHHNKKNPFELAGVIGAFNRAYADFNDVIKSYDLPYEGDEDGRWKLVGAVAEAGLSVVTDGLVFSHHVHDPAYGKTCSAFDLVRLHRFWELDEECSEQISVNRRPSHNAMLELASTDARVVAELVGVDFAEEMDGVESEVLGDQWKLQLSLHPRTGKITDTIDNWDLIAAHEEPFPSLFYNEFSMAIEVDKDLPWRPLDKGGAVFSVIDRAALCLQIEREYGVRPPRGLIDEIINAKAQQRFVNPVKDYLGELKWDGTPRIETCLPGVHPTPYTRMVARKSLVAAVARIFEPGVKWDHTMVLFGSEGLGKSYWVDKMSRGYSTSLGRIGDKDTLITMQRSWIMISDEGYSLRKADQDMQKEFLTRTADIFRMPYDREAQVHKRHCVIWGTTNDEVFLRRQEGNRRFLIVRCEEKVDFEALTDAYIDQVWAEAVHLYRAGELLFLADSESKVAAAEREQFIEEDALAGAIEAFLETRVPEDWDEMSQFTRQQWLQNRADNLVPEGTVLQTKTCSIQLWVEAMGKRFGDHRRADLLEINTILKRIPGWRQLPGRHRIPLYGPQVVFVRETEELI